MIAYVDESLRLDGEGRYVLAAVLVPDARADEIRAALRSTLRRGQRRFHWHAERASNRESMARLVATLGVDALVVTATPVEAARQERARRRCLRVLLWEVELRGVTHVVLESRQQRDPDDDRMISYARQARWVSAALRYDFRRPEREPLLWLPDVVAGAVTRSLADNDRSYADALGDVTVIHAS